MNKHDDRVADREVRQKLEATVSNLCLISIVLGMVALCLMLPLMIVNSRAGIAALFFAMLAIPSGFGGKLLTMFWLKEDE